MSTAARFRPKQHGTEVNKRLLFMLIGAFLILAPASVSSADGADDLKWVRVGVLAAAFLLGLKWFRMPRFSEMSGKVLFLAVVYCAAAIWSTSPMWGLLYKGMFVCSTCAAIALARCLRTDTDFRALCRTTTTTACVGLILLGIQIFARGDYMIWHGRLVVSGMNANTLGLSAAIFALLALLHLMVGDGLGWKVLTLSVIATMSVLIVYSGSRAAVLVLVAGVVLLLPLMAKKKSHGIVLGVLSISSIAALAVIWAGLSEPEAGSYTSDSPLRLVEELTKDTRLTVWRSVLRQWSRGDIVLGDGWRHTRNKWRFVQSSYIQVVVEAGVLGMFAVLIFLIGTVQTLSRSLKMAKRSRGFQSVVLYLFSATFFAVVFHGVFESSLIVGTTPNAILLGFSAAQLDLQLQASAPAQQVVQRRQVQPQIPSMRSRMPGQV